MRQVRTLPWLVSVSLLVPVAAAQAQGDVSTSFTGQAGPYVLQCGPYTASGASASVSTAPCTNGGGVFGSYAREGSLGAASVNTGVTHSEGIASVVVTGGITPVPINGTAQITSNSLWNDVLTWSNPNVASVGVTYGITGSAFESPNVNAGGFTGTGNDAQAQIGLTYGSGSQSYAQNWNGYTTADVSAFEGLPYNDPPAPAAYYAMHNDLIHATTFQEYTTTGLSLPLFWSSYVSGASVAGNVLSGEANQAYAYGNANGGLVSIQFFDANHVDITNQVNYQFENGAGLSMSSVPEPTSFALLGTGLVGLIPLVRRKRSLIC